MKKYLIILLLSIFVGGITVASTESIPKQLFVDCRGYYDDFIAIVDTVNNQGRGKYSQSDYDSAKMLYETCHANNLSDFDNYIERGSRSINHGLYPEALNSYELAWEMIETEIDSLEQSIISLYLSLSREAYQRGEYEKVDDLLGNLKHYNTNDGQQFQIYYLRALLFSSEGNFDLAKNLAEKAQQYAHTDKENKELENYLKYVTNRVSAPSNDLLSYQQPRLSSLNIAQAWQDYDLDKKVVVAVIDNGFSIDHPDLKGRVWTNSREIANNGRDDDNNGYVDDIHGYNFFNDNADIVSLGDHGTQVASIIGAIANNEIGVAGISQNVEMMSLVVCNNEYCLHSSELSDAIIYAVDNGANIINMSLVSKNATFNPALTDAIKYATDKGVIVVIAAGNGLVVGDSTIGVNTTDGAISPVCNEGTDRKRIIGVGASDDAGNRLKWSNYGKCVDLYTYGEKVVTASVQSATDDSYLIADGTSFSSPIIAGMVALGYNIFGQRDYVDVYDALIQSLDGDAHPDMLKYLDLIGPKDEVISISAEKQVQMDRLFVLIDRTLKKHNPITRKQKLQMYIDFLNAYESRLDKKGLTERLVLLREMRTRFQQRIENRE